ncbi:MAG: MFS transporter, partial [Caldisericaceae bacterium]
MQVEDFLEKKVSKGVQVKLLLVSALFWATVASGVMVMSLTLPKIALYYNIDQTKTSLIASFTFLGMLIGATLFGNVSDYFGRKPLIAITLVLTAVFTALTGIRMNFNLLLLVRFLAGMGMGGLLPVVNSYLAEFSPKSIRGRNLVLLEASWAIGSIIIGVFAVTVGKTNWQLDYYVFIFSLVFLFTLFSIPESIKFLLKKKRFDELNKNL